MTSTDPIPFPAQPGPVPPADALARFADELERLDSREDRAAARKRLRQTLVALPGSGWCERAELLISDRIDGALDARGDRVLTVHLESCQRCADHEQALVRAERAVGARVAEPEPPRPPVLQLVEPEPEERLEVMPIGPMSYVWATLSAIAVVLTVAAVVVAILGVLGAG